MRIEAPSYSALAWKSQYDFREDHLVSSLEVYQCWSVTDRLEPAPKLTLDSRLKGAHLEVRLDFKC